MSAHKAPARRRFLQQSAAAAGCAGALSLGLAAWIRPARAAAALRPPGALAEADFLAACVRCGLCVQACPFDTLSLARTGDEVALGTPLFHARDVPCEMCDDIPCAKACPTGALSKSLLNINDARIGLAVLSDQENCLNFLGLRCDVCYRVCPAIDKAITLESHHNPRQAKEGAAATRHAMLLPVVHSDACTGCGKCEKACVLPEPAIRVLPRHLAQGAPAEHYRKGWDEKTRHGGSLIGEQTRLPVRGQDDTPNPGGTP